MSGNGIEIEPVTPVIGAEVFGVDLSGDLDEETVERLRDALREHLVLFFRDQAMSLDQHKAFGSRFGALHVHPTAPAPEGHPEVLIVHADAQSKAVAGNRWHSDVSCDAAPPMGSILHMHTLPAAGGDTMFANMYAAYEALSEPIRELLDGLKAWHESEHVYRGILDFKDQRREGGDNYPASLHPVVRTHPETGRKCLFVNEGFTTRIEGLDGPESRALLTMLFDHVRTPEFQCRFRWRKHSVAFWDNRCVQHYALWDYFPAERHGFRVTIEGDRPH